jgi:mono/diheme cytochrome c family protein
VMEGRRPMRTRVRIVLVVVVAVLAVAAAVATLALRHGFSARDEPTRLEALMAAAARRYSVPADLRHRANPVVLTPAVLKEARAHFADHCAYCHGNDGRGQTSIGRSLYPRVPDMTGRDTQSRSDGELFATIENGIRLTGMPAFGDGTAASAYGSWTLVHFIRNLSRLTPDELEEMKALNPKSRSEWEAEAEAESFLEGGRPRSAEPAAPHAH